MTQSNFELREPYGDGLDPMAVGNLRFELRADKQASTLDGDGTGTWTEQVNSVDMDPIAVNASAAEYSATGWDATHPGVIFLDATPFSSIRAAASGNFDAAVVFARPFTTAMVVNLTSAGNQNWFFGSADDTCNVVKPGAADDIQAEFGNVGGVGSEWWTGSDADYSGRALFFVDILEAASNNIQGWRNGTAGSANATADVGTADPASGGITLGADWACAAPNAATVAHVCVWGGLLPAATKNELANNFFRETWGDYFTTWAL